jgi:hypothetical protein
MPIFTLPQKRTLVDMAEVADTVGEHVFSLDINKWVSDVRLSDTAESF